jgi:glycyl-tRNA synthetase
VKPWKREGWVKAKVLRTVVRTNSIYHDPKHPRTQMSFDDISRLAHQRGFFFKAAESYPNSPAGFWDYGPLGVSFRNKFIELWRRLLVKRDGMVEVDGTQILPKSVFEASGHLTGFTDPLVECSNCHSVYRPDKLIEEKAGKAVPEKLTDKEYDDLLREYKIKCQKCGWKLSGTKRFNMVFRVGVGAAQEEAYLRPETCQTIFVDFPLLFKTQRIKLPIGFAQFGRSFRNEIAPRQGILRQREFYQAEIEVFFNPKKVDDVAKFETRLGTTVRFLLPDGSSAKKSLREAIRDGTVTNKLVGHYLALIEEFYEAAGLDAEKLRFRKLTDEERAFYSKVAYDLEAKTSVGWLELVACNYRSDYDLSRHSQASGSDFTVDDDGEKVLPHIFELSMGVDRSLYALLESAAKVEGERRYLDLRPFLSPLQVGIFPLLSKDGLPEEAEKLVGRLRDDLDVFSDESGSIGRRYARADEVGVPFCVTVDYETMKDGTVTIRYRDSKTQERVKEDELRGKIQALLRPPSIAE